MIERFRGLRIGYAVTGSFCPFAKSFEQAELLAGMGAELLPIMSEHAATISTRFGTAQENLKRLRDIAGRDVITDIASAEPIGPKDMTDIMVVAPCTSNTAARLRVGITDGAVTMAVKSHLRGGKPVVLAVASNDSLMGSAPNLGELLCRKGYYFVPMRQDDVVKKPASLVAEFSLLPAAIEAALRGVQLRPLFL